MRINEPKMTFEETIKVLKNMIPKTCKMVNGRYVGGFEDTECPQFEAVQVAIEALEKQIPKRTEIKDDEAAEIFAYNKKGVPILKFPTRTAKILCPRCRCENPTHPYCSKCGQKIDGILS